MLLLRLSKGISSGCTTPPQHKVFLNCHYFGKWALSSCFDLDKVFPQGADMPPLHTNFLKELLSLEGWNCASAST